ncbi:MAG: zinc-binding dehydrogenase, partial [Bacteroidales bacterium]|nr:zinc-binding dehydrogenase [Bacteroidales bacterium]
GIELLYVNTRNQENPSEHLRSLTGGKGFDDVFVFAPVRPVVEQADHILGMDGCLNFFAGPEDQAFSAMMNFYKVHYAFTHVVGTSGGNTGDMKEALDLMGKGSINPAVMVTHIGGLDAVIDTTKRLPEIPGGKKLIYTNISLELTAIDDFREKGNSDSFFKDLADIVDAKDGIWNKQAEDYILKNGTPI